MRTTHLLSALLVAGGMALAASAGDGAAGRARQSAPARVAQARRDLLGAGSPLFQGGDAGVALAAAGSERLAPPFNEGRSEADRGPVS